MHEYSVYCTNKYKSVYKSVAYHKIPSACGNLHVPRYRYSLLPRVKNSLFSEIVKHLVVDIKPVSTLSILRITLPFLQHLFCYTPERK